MGQTQSKGPTSQDKAILELKVQRDRLQQYKKRTALAAERETQAARELLARNERPKALLALRRKKFHESLIATADAQLEQLLQLTANIEFASIQRDVLSGIEKGTKALQEINRQMGGLEAVEKLMDDTAEAVAYQKELSELLGGRLTRADNDEVDEELARLEQELAPAKAVASPSAQEQAQGQAQEQEQQLPTAPSGDVVAPQREDEEVEAEAQQQPSEGRVMLPA